MSAMHSKPNTINYLPVDALVVTDAVSLRCNANNLPTVWARQVLMYLDMQISSSAALMRFSCRGA
eukprot:scaffold221841_cov14-Prasinocladus_malaysianus.AAC.2